MSIDSGELKWSKSLGWSLEEYKDYLKNLNEICRLREISSKEILEMKEFIEILNKTNILFKFCFLNKFIAKSNVDAIILSLFAIKSYAYL